jgi:hypothetical protein
LQLNFFSKSGRITGNNPESDVLVVVDRIKWQPDAELNAARIEVGVGAAVAAVVGDATGALDDAVVGATVGAGALVAAGAGAVVGTGACVGGTGVAVGVAAQAIMVSAISANNTISTIRFISSSPLG